MIVRLWGTSSTPTPSARWPAVSSAIFPVLTPLGVGPGQPFPYISGLSLGLAVLARDPSGEERFARVKVPEGLPRSSPPGRTDAGAPRSVIARFLDRAVPRHGSPRAGHLQVTRDGRGRGCSGADDLLGAVEPNPERRHCGGISAHQGLELKAPRMFDDSSRVRRRQRTQVYSPRPHRPRRSRTAGRRRPARSLGGMPPYRFDACAARARQAAAQALRRIQQQHPHAAGRLSRWTAAREHWCARAARGPGRDRDEDRRVPGQTATARSSPRWMDPPTKNDVLPAREKGALQQDPEHRAVVAEGTGAGRRPRRLQAPDLKVRAGGELVVRRATGSRYVHVGHQQLPRGRREVIFKDISLYTGRGQDRPTTWHSCSTTLTHNSADRAT